MFLCADLYSKYLRAQFTADLPGTCYAGPHVIAVEGKSKRGFAKVYMLRL